MTVALGNRSGIYAHALCRPLFYTPIPLFLPAPQTPTPLFTHNVVTPYLICSLDLSRVSPAVALYTEGVLKLKMACKRKLEYFDVSEAKESSNAVVDGVVTDLSPVKKSKKDDSVKYFSSEVSDGKTRLRVICFQPQLREKLSSYLEGKSAVSLVNYQVREARGGSSEVVLTKSSKVEAGNA